MKLLLVVDMQKGFMKNKKYITLNDKIKSLIPDYDKVIFTKFINNKNKNSLYQEKLNWNDLKTKSEQALSIIPPKDAIIIEKSGYGLSQKDLEYIKSLNIKEIDICGVKTDACIYAISLQLWDNGIYPNILTKYITGDFNITKIFKKQFGTK